VAAGFTSTVLAPQTIHEAAIVEEDVVRYERVKKKGIYHSVHLVCWETALVLIFVTYFVEPLLPNSVDAFSEFLTFFGIWHGFWLHYILLLFSQYVV
jgi:hypothetical protein